VPNSQFKLSQQCLDTTSVDNVPPFKIECGTYTVPVDGEIKTNCKLGICTTKNNRYCEDVSMRYLSYSVGKFLVSFESQISD